MGTGTARIRETDITVLKSLPGKLAREGYYDAYAIYGNLNLRTDLWSADLDLLPPGLRVLFSVFLAGQTQNREQLLQVFHDTEVDSLVNLGILLRGDEGFHTGDMILLPVLGFLLFAQRPGVNPIAYFGEDSAAFMMHLAPPRGSVCLDLCTGPGVQALVCSARASKVTGVEINPFAAAHAELNVVMNGLEDRVEIRTGDLYGAVDGMQFDFICANPPLLPFPPGLPYPFVGHGGADGLDVTRRIIAGLSSSLKPNGICQIIGACTGDWNGPACEQELRDLASREGLRITMTVPSANALVPGARMFDGLAWTCATAAKLDYEEVKLELQVHLQSIGATHLYLYFLAIAADGRPGFGITRHYQEHCGFWHIHQ